MLRVAVGGETFELHHAKGETDDATWAWVPARRILCTGDLFIWASPNCGNPQKVQRYAKDWAVALRTMADLGAETLLPGHGLPILGVDRVREPEPRLSTPQIPANLQQAADIPREHCFCPRGEDMLRLALAEPGRHLWLRQIVTAGRPAAELLAELSPDAVPVFLAACVSTNSDARLNALRGFEHLHIQRAWRSGRTPDSEPVAAAVEHPLGPFVLVCNRGGSGCGHCRA